MIACAGAAAAWVILNQNQREEEYHQTVMRVSRSERVIEPVVVYDWEIRNAIEELEKEGKI